jgi:hypothetical protein
MARNRNLAGLAALGALGYYMARGDKKGPGEAVPIPEDRGTMTGDAFTRAAGLQAAASPAAVTRADDEGRAGFLRSDEGDLYTLDPNLAASMVRRPGAAPGRTASTRSMAPASAANIPMEVPSRGRREMLKNPQRGPSYEEIAAYNRAPAAPVATRSMTPARPQTREEAIAQIPTSTGSRYSSVASDTDPSLRETGSEFGRNVGNTLAALTPLGGGFGKVGAELATAKGAAERAAKSRELAQEAIRTQKPTKFTSTKSTAPARTSAATKSRVKKFNEEEAGVEFKRGGSAKTKKMASGGMSSASKRGDGIASRGKTKCKMY